MRTKIYILRHNFKVGKYRRFDDYYLITDADCRNQQSELDLKFVSQQ
jgi:hypothetical protein